MCQGHLSAPCILQEWGSLSISAMLHLWLDTAHGKRGLGAEVAMDFRMQQLGLWGSHPPCSQGSGRHLLMEAQASGRSHV